MSENPQHESDQQDQSAEEVREVPETSIASEAESVVEPVADPEAAAPESEKTPEPESAAESVAAETPGSVAASMPEAVAVPTAGPVPDANATPNASPAPTPATVPTPAAVPPRPRPVPMPSALATHGASTPATPESPAPVAPVAPAALDPQAVAAAAAFGRVDDEGNVLLREGEVERRVGQVPGVAADEAMDLFIRRFLDLEAQVALLETRVRTAAIKDVTSSITSVEEALVEPAVIGDVAALRERMTHVQAVATERRAQADAERAAAREKARAEREEIVAEAEKIAAQDPQRTQWKQSGERLRTLLGTWQEAQKRGPRLERAAEDSLWKRFSHARTTFDRHRRQHFSELDAKQGEAKKLKEQLIARAQELSASTDWGRTSGEYRRLMDEWKAAGRANRKEDDALWARFRAAQQTFFDARDAANKELDSEYGENLVVKEQILTEAEKLVPVTDLAAAKKALRDLQDRWDAAGKVPRADVQRVEGRMRKVEAAIRDADEAEWKRSNPETRARAEGMAAQLEAAIEGLQRDLDAAKAKGDAAKITAAQEALDARTAWLEQVRAAQS